MTAARSPAAALAQGKVLQMSANIRHTRLGKLRHAFSYRADYLLLSPESCTRSQGLLRRNANGIIALWDRDHGGQPGQGQGAPWAWAQLEAAGITRRPDMVLGLLTQSRTFGFGFNPVSFWLLWQGDDLIAVIAEVTNTWRQRHSYLCRNKDLSPLTSRHAPQVQKTFHVSPFQDVAGNYRFRFGITADMADILICHDAPDAGLVARMQGPLVPLRQTHLFKSLMTKPGGALRVVALIYWQAFRLKLRGALWRPLPQPPRQDLSE